VSHGRDAPGCFDLPFLAAYPLGESAEVALEDYTRAVLRCEAAEALRAGDEPSRVTGVHVCGLAATPARAALIDLEDFAREMAVRGGGEGLGWA
jgi:hypothetical protein